MWFRETSESEPFDEASKMWTDEVKTGLLYWAQDKFRGNLFTA